MAEWLAISIHRGTKMADDLLNDTKTYPRMAHWFDPVLLLQLLNNVIVSSMFGQYADRRLMIAALDTVPPEEHASRAEEFRSRLKPDEKGGVWFDWVCLLYTSDAADE